MKIGGKCHRVRLKMACSFFRTLVCSAKEKPLTKILVECRGPDYYKLELGITRTIPSAETLRQRMDDIVSSLREEIRNVNVEIIHTYNMMPGSKAPK